jgi:putative MATE family efflux protein
VKDLTKGHVGGNILRFAAPMLIGNLFQQSYNIVDSIIVGRILGKEALAAVGASFPIIFALISFVIGIASGGTIVVSQYFGAKDYRRVRRAIDTIYIFIFFASLVIMTVGITFSEEIFRMTKLPPEVIPQATLYLNTFLLGTILLFGFNGTSAILRGLGDSVTPLVFMVIASLSNIGFDLLFIKYFGFGIQGAAWATILSHGGAFLTAVLYLNKTHKIVQLKLKELVFDWSIFRNSVRIGVPSGFQNTFVAFGMIALFRIVNEFGTNVVAAYSVAGRIDSLAMLPAMTFGQALSTFVGQNMGANKPERIKSGLLSTLALSSVTSVLITTVVILFRFSLMSLFSKDIHVIETGMEYLVIVSSSYLIFSTMLSINGTLRGAGDTVVPMFISLFSLWVIRIPFAYFLSGRYGETGIWLAVPIAWMIGALFSFFYYLTGNWKKKVIVKHHEEKIDGTL